jgi:hypothetical protein
MSRGQTEWKNSCGDSTMEERQPIYTKVRGILAGRPAGHKNDACFKSDTRYTSVDEKFHIQPKAPWRSEIYEELERARKRGGWMRTGAVGTGEVGTDEA